MGEDENFSGAVVGDSTGGSSEDQTIGEDNWTHHFWGKCGIRWIYSGVEGKI
jgi:hypothetical protein